MKKTKATKSDLEYIKANRDYDVQQLAKDTELTVQAVRKVLQDLDVTDPPKKEETQFSKSMLHSKRPDGKRGNATIMSPAASMIADETKRPGDIRKASFIHKPLGDRN